MKRRTFALGTVASAAGLALDVAQPGRWMQALAGELHAAGPDSSERIVVVIQLSGGNDGLNTVIPYSNELYAKARPKLQVASSDVIPFQSELGLHPSLRSLEPLWADNRWCVVQGVGYAAPNRSHFESMDIWHSCHRKNERTQSGWIGRWLASQTELKQKDAPGVHIGAEPLPLALVERGVQVPSLASIEQMRLKSKTQAMEMESGDGANEATRERDQESNSIATGEEAESDLLGFVETSTSAALEASLRLEKALAAPDQSGEFPNSGLGEKLKVISRLILAGVKTRVYYVTLDGFDTHANQLPVHTALLRQWSEAISAFCGRMARAGQQDRVLVMTFSEFGRRVSENASQGTDHGAAAPMFFAGPSFEQPLVGEHPSLSDLDDGDLQFRTDFRDVYAAVVERWLGTPSQKVLDGDYRSGADRLALFRPA